MRLQNLKARTACRKCGGIGHSMPYAKEQGRQRCTKKQDPHRFLHPLVREPRRKPCTDPPEQIIRHGYGRFCRCVPYGTKWSLNDQEAWVEQRRSGRRYHGHQKFLRRDWPGRSSSSDYIGDDDHSAIASKSKTNVRAQGRSVLHWLPQNPVVPRTETRRATSTGPW